MVFVLRCIWRRISSGLGIPGVGVAPGLNGFFNVSGSGIPGVGVPPFGKTFAAFGSGIPGVEFDDGAIGLVDKPGGRLLASTVTLPAPTAEFAFAFAEFEFESAEPHADRKSANDRKKMLTETFDINFKTSSI